MSSEETKEMKEELSQEEVAEEQTPNEQEVQDQAEVKQDKDDEKQQRIEELETELSSVKDSLLRKAAELENVRKRVQKERVQIFEQAKAGALEDFLPINDDLIRTLKAAEESKVEDSFLDGVKMVSEKFKEVLEKHGVKRIDETGVPFNVDIHDAMLKQPAADKDTESDIVLEVLESGYMIGDRTIRHAKVIVSE